MQLTKLSVKNYKTYLTLELDLSVQPDKPIILIGGANGGGKTTFFEAICGALYGLREPNNKTLATPSYFKELLNAGAPQVESSKIELELTFTGRVAGKEKNFTLKRIYLLNSETKVAFSVQMGMDGNMFTYGSASSDFEKKSQKAQIDKMIKANLPENLSRYFLFDALEAGNLLKEDRLNQVIKDNIENVLGFKKYYDLHAAVQDLHADSVAKRQKDDADARAYQDLIEKRKKLEDELQNAEQTIVHCLNYSTANRELYEQTKNGKDQNAELQKQIKKLENQIKEIDNLEEEYYKEAQRFAQNIEDNIAFPYLQKNFQDIIRTASQAHSSERAQNARPSSDALAEFIDETFLFLAQNEIISAKELEKLEKTALLNFLLSRRPKDEANPFDFLETPELKELEKLLNNKAYNGFPALALRQNRLEGALDEREELKERLQTRRTQLGQGDYKLIEDFEKNEINRQKAQDSKAKIERELEQLERKLGEYDLSASANPDPRHEALQKLKPFFETVANRLLVQKKKSIEAAMREDLNANLSAYQGFIDRVEFSDQLKTLTFKIFHQKGNEIPLNHLNTASKQIVAQVLLKALHELGDYDPPVMIDAVMGVLDKEGRRTALEYYFPKLARQTILLSSDSEIDPDSDYDKIAPFVSRAYTLVRDKEAQCTKVESGYFNR